MTKFSWNFPSAILTVTYSAVPLPNILLSYYSIVCNPPAHYSAIYLSKISSIKMFLPLKYFLSCGSPFCHPLYQLYVAFLPFKIQNLLIQLFNMSSFIQYFVILLSNFLPSFLICKNVLPYFFEISSHDPVQYSADPAAQYPTILLSNCAMILSNILSSVVC